MALRDEYTLSKVKDGEYITSYSLLLKQLLQMI